MIAYIPIVIFAILVIVVNIVDWKWRKTATEQEIRDLDNTNQDW